MALSVTVQSASSTPVGGGTWSLGPFTITGTIVPVPLSNNLQSGNTTFTVATGAIGVIIAPPAGNAVVIKQKTITGDTGTAIPEASPSVVLFDPSSPPTSFFLNAASNTNGYTTITFF